MIAETTCEWINSSDHIPEAGKRVLCFCTDGMIRLMEIIEFKTFYMWSEGE